MTSTDEELVARSRGGDLDSFNQLVLRWERPIYALAYRVIGREDVLSVLPALVVTVASSLATVACVDDGEQAAPTAADVAACPSTTFRIGEVRLPRRSTEVATSGTAPMPTAWWLRPDSSAARVGEQMAVV